jgi:thiosulfate/3-mercaptopyruvate sulfurtransferase
MPAAIHTTLVDGATLAARLGDPAWVVVDCRHDLADPAAGEAAYARGHIPGAVFLHLDRDLSAAKNGRNGRHPLPDIATLAATLGRAGIGAGVQVVAYDDCGGMMAGRLWWLLRWLGHEAVALLDGGLPAWTAAGGALSAEMPEPAARTFTPAPRDWVLSADQVLAGLGRPDRVWTEVLAGLAPEQVVHQCGSGVSACHNLLAMEIAGLPGARLYAGSWSEWCADPARPVER